MELLIGSVTYYVDADIAKHLYEALAGQENPAPHAPNKGQKNPIGPAMLIYTLMTGNSPGPQDVLGHLNNDQRDFRRVNVYPTTKTLVAQRCRALARKNNPHTRPERRKNLGGITKEVKGGQTYYRVRLTIHSVRVSGGLHLTLEDAINARQKLLSRHKRKKK